MGRKKRKIFLAKITKKRLESLVVRGNVTEATQEINLEMPVLAEEPVVEIPQPTVFEEPVAEEVTPVVTPAPEPVKAQSRISASRRLKA